MGSIYVWHGISSAVVSQFPLEMGNSVKKVKDRVPDLDVVVIDADGLDKLNKLPCKQLGHWRKHFVLYVPQTDLLVVNGRWCEHTVEMIAAIVQHGSWTALRQAVCPQQLREDWDQLAAEVVPANMGRLKNKGSFDMVLSDFPNLDRKIREHLVVCPMCADRFLAAARHSLADLAVEERIGSTGDLLSMLRRALGDQ